MAKISARGAHEVAKFAARSPRGYRQLVVLRSDGQVLRRLADGDIKGSYKVWGALETADRATLLRVLERRGYTEIEERS